LSDDELLFVGPGNTPALLKETVASINRIKYKEHSEREELDFGYFKQILQGKGGKRIKYLPRQMQELATLFESKELMNAAIERMIEEEQETKGVHIVTEPGQDALPTVPGSELPRTPFLPPVAQVLTRSMKRKRDTTKTPKSKTDVVARRTRSKAKLTAQ